MDFKKSSFTKPNCLKSKFTCGFVHSLNHIHKRRPTSESLSTREIYKNYCKVKLAAESSMVVAVGHKKAWSRAMMFRIRSPQSRKSSAKKVRKVTLSCPRKIAKISRAKKIGDHEDCHKYGIGQTKELRGIVPGGKEMDLCRLLTETAHYIQCLNTQVQVMRSLADFYSG